MPLSMTWFGLDSLILSFLHPEDYTGWDWLLGLYINNYTPTLDSTFGDLVEATFTGYSGVNLSDADWQGPTHIDDRSEMVYGSSPLSWTNTGGSSQTIYGYFVLDNGTGNLVWAELFETPRVLGPLAELQLDAKIYTRNDPSPP